MNREQLKRLAVAGTITFPATFPRVAELQLRPASRLPGVSGEQGQSYLVATEQPSLRVTMKRVVLVDDVRAVFIPRDPHAVHVDDGTWLLGSEIEDTLRLRAANSQRVFGIVYVAEQVATLLEVEAGMTAAESAQYYPPLPSDRSVNHYDPYRSLHNVHASESNGSTLQQPVPEATMCEPDETLAARAVPENVPERQIVASQTHFCEPDEHPTPVAQSVQARTAFEPAPYPSVVSRR